MKKDGKYRFSLQFSGDTQKKRGVGELLEGMGNRKSALIVRAVCEYIQNHADIPVGLTQPPPKSSVAIMPLESHIDIKENESIMEQRTKLPDTVEERNGISQMLYNLDGFMQ